MTPLAACRLYTFIDSAYLHGREPGDIARQLCAGGADLIQLRAKDWDRERIESAARSILPITRDHGVRLVINDHLEVALRVGADVCHLGQEDFFDAGYNHVAELLQKQDASNLQIGLSTHAPEQAERAIRAGASYVAIGPVFPTGTKPRAKAVTLEYVRWAARNVSIPWFAIGGITLENVSQVIAAGAQGICVVSAILNSKDVAQTCRLFREAL
ncbi:MAG TPA: thiamine phosphate synthase [Verrucomicrobiae bacterium]|nr:thiamine phosphate synthase [Verrucomicrobiae bacterium]